MNEQTKKQNINQNEGEKNMYTKNVLWQDDFKELLTFLNIIKQPNFDDFCIVKGQFRSRSNSNICVVETYFDYFNDMDFIISDINALVKILSTLDKKSDITVTVDDKIVSFTDGYQTFKVVKGLEKNCDNKFMTVEELDDIFAKEIDNDKPLIKETLPKPIVCNMNKIARDLNTDSITFCHDEDNLNKGFILINPTGYGPSNTSLEYTIKLKEDLLTAMNKDHYFNITTLPYGFNKSDMTLDFKFFNNPVNNDPVASDPRILAIIHYTNISELSITIYSKSPYIEIDDQ